MDLGNLSTKNKKLMKRILILDDNLTVCLMLKSWLVKKDYNVDTATSVDEAIEKVKNKPFDLILSDIRMPGADGFSFLSWVKKFDSDILVIMMTGFSDVETAVESLKSGAVDYIAKPIEPENLFSKIEDAFRLQQNQKDIKKIASDFLLPPLDKYKFFSDLIHDVAINDSHLLIVGDKGTGKMSLAKQIFERKSEPTKPFIVLDSAEIVLKKRLMSGIEDITGIDEHFEMAKGGVLFVKNAESLDSKCQDRLLDNILKQKKDEDFRQCFLSSDCTLKELKKVLLPKLFNLFDKVIEFPRLSDDKDVILYFANHFIQFANNETNKNIKKIDKKVVDSLLSYSWPGNIQELKNTIFKAVLFSEGTEIKSDVLPFLFQKSLSDINSGSQPFVDDSGSDVESLRKENYEKEKIIEALEIAKGNKTVASSILNIDRKTLYNKIKLYKIDQ